jgi:hypothetical protein
VFSRLAKVNLHKVAKGVINSSPVLSIIKDYAYPVTSAYIQPMTKIKNHEIEHVQYPKSYSTDQEKMMKNFSRVLPI